ncbi:major centromere autoantigen B [Nephila pilipes]|uniref:Major centromere autoantigen B n=1 Tax=Nephila pilipes TaxID=299642 RepID=A0A8X6TWR0_NEPPI|nr:major centromere autoantigen B [Nephila pilipes]
MESPTPEEKADDNKELNKNAPTKKPPASKRKALTLKEKADIIEEFDKNPFLSKVALARKFNLSRTTLHSIVAKREAIAESMMKYGSFSSMRKKSRTSPFQEIEGKLLMWLEYARSLHLPVNGFLLRQQAIIIAKDLGFAQFTASNGWIERFKSRHGIFWKASKYNGNGMAHIVCVAMAVYEVAMACVCMARGRIVYECNGHALLCMSMYVYVWYNGRSQYMVTCMWHGI